MQGDFNDIHEFLLSNIEKIGLPEELVNIELSISRFELEALLRVEKVLGITMSNLAQSMSVPMSTATGIVDRLVSKCLLKRDRTEEDRRIVTVTLTDEGRALLARVHKHYFDFIGRIQGILTQDEMEAAFKLIRKVITGLQQEKLAADTNKGKERKKIIIE